MNKWILLIMCLITSVHLAQADWVTNSAVAAGFVYDNTDAGDGTYGGSADGATADGRNISLNNTFNAGSYGSVSQMRRSFLMFDVPALNAGETLKSATLRIYLDAKYDQQSADMVMSLYAASRASQPVQLSDFNSTAFSDTGLGHDETVAADTWLEFNVTGFVQTAMDDGNQAAFRIQLDEDGLLQLALNAMFMYIGPGSATLAPELVMNITSGEIVASYDWDTACASEFDSDPVSRTADGFSWGFNNNAGSSTITTILDDLNYHFDTTNTMALLADGSTNYPGINNGLRIHSDGRMVPNYSGNAVIHWTAPSSGYYDWQYTFTETWSNAAGDGVIVTVDALNDNSGFTEVTSLHIGEGAASDQVTASGTNVYFQVGDTVAFVVNDNETSAYDLVDPDIQFYLTSTAAGYTAFSSIYGLSEGPDGDDDSDDLSNLYEYGLGGNPTNGLDRGILPVSTVITDGGINWLEYTYPVLTDEDSGIIYYLETSPELIQAAWSNIGYQVVGTNLTGETFNYITNRISTMDKDHQFVRLVIEQLQ